MSVRINISPTPFSLTPDSPNRISLTVFEIRQHHDGILCAVGFVCFYGLGILAIVGGGCLVFLISDTFTVPLGKLVEGVRALEAGNFEYELKPAGGDEVAQVTRAFDRMRFDAESQCRGKAIARRSNFGNRKKWKRSDGSPAESLTISTTCSPLSKGHSDLLADSASFFRAAAAELRANQQCHIPRGWPHKTIARL